MDSITSDLITAVCDSCWHLSVETCWVAAVVGRCHRNVKHLQSCLKASKVSS